MTATGHEDNTADTAGKADAGASGNGLAACPCGVISNRGLTDGLCTACWLERFGAAWCPCCGERVWWLDPENELTKRQGWDAFAAALVNAAARDHAEAQLAVIAPSVPPVAGEESHA